MVDKVSVEESISRARESNPASQGQAPGENRDGSQRGKYERKKDPASKARRSDAVKAAWRKRKGEPEPAPIPEPITAGEIAAYGLLGATLWKLVGGMVGMRPLFDKPQPGEEQSERDMLGAALAPLGRKYVPVMDRWAEEINAVVVIAVLFDRTRLSPEERARQKQEREGIPVEVGSADSGY